MAFSADGKTLASISETELKFWDVESGELKQTVAPGGYFVTFLGHTNSVLVSSNESMRRVSVENGRVVTVYPDYLFRKYNSKPAPSADGTEIAGVVHRDDKTYIVQIDALTGEVRKETKLLDFSNTGLRWLLSGSPAGGSIYAFFGENVFEISADGSIQKQKVDEKGLVNGVFIGKSRWAVATKYFCSSAAIGGSLSDQKYWFWETKGVHAYKDIALHPENEYLTAVASYTTLHV